MNGEAIVLTQRAQQQLLVLNALERGELFMVQAADLLALSVRQVRRLRAAYRQRGAQALVHGNRGRRSPRRVAEAIRDQVISLARTTYAEVNHKHLTELLAEREGLILSHPTVHRLLRAAGIRSPRRRRPPKHRRRRERMPQRGLLIQLDGSDHDWLQDRGPRLVLLAALDDATGEVLAATFRDHEDAHGYLLLLRALTQRHGLPVAAYSDRHGIFHRDKRTPLTLDEQLRGGPDPTQVGRALQELSIRWIPASSPQAKGRIERLFGTFQDRLRTELRLAGISDRESANAFLDGFVPRYNARFAQAPADPVSAFRPWPTDRDLDAVFCFKYRRTVANDNTITVGPHTVQILAGPTGRSYAKARVEVHERLDGQVAVLYQGRHLASRLLTGAHLLAVPAREYDRVHPLEAGRPRLRGGSRIPAPSRKSRPGGSGGAVTRRRPPSAPAGPRRPDADHPWRQTVLTKAMKREIEAGRTNSLNR